MNPPSCNDNQPANASFIEEVKFAFPFKLHHILDGADKFGFSSIVSWQPHGMAFLIHKPHVFEALILPKYFEHAKLRSFHRQLHIYGFQRIKNKNSLEYNSFYHELFCRGDQSLCTRMKRVKVKGGKETQPNQPEPNFYSQRSLSRTQICSSINNNLSPEVTLPSSARFPSNRPSCIVGTTAQREEPLGSVDCWQRVVRLLASSEEKTPLCLSGVESSQNAVGNASNECWRRPKVEEIISCGHSDDKEFEDMEFCGKRFFSIP